MSKKLLTEIEHCRKEMVRLTTELPLSSEEVVEISVKLDELLNEYDKLIKNKSEKQQLYKCS